MDETMKQKKMVKEQQFKLTMVDVEKEVQICDHCGKEADYGFKQCYFCQGTDVCDSCMETYEHLDLGCYIMIDYLSICPTCKPKYLTYIQTIQQLVKDIHILEEKREHIEMILWKAHNTLKGDKQ
jgi:hypothetical protein